MLTRIDMINAGAKYNSMLQLDPAVKDKVADAIIQINAFRDRWNEIERAEPAKLRQLSALLNTMLSASGGNNYSNQVLNDDEKADALNAVLHREDRDIEKYLSAFEIIILQFGSGDLSLKDMLNIHSLLMRGEDNALAVGELRTIAVVTDVEFPPGIVRKYQRDDWRTVPGSLQQLIDWVNDDSTIAHVDPIVICGLFMYEFLSIHPFADGNGRTARMITTLLLLKYGFSFAKYAKLEFAVQRRKLWCINALIKDQHQRNSNDEVLNNWIPFFTDTLLLMTRYCENSLSKAGI